jgi:hypothetical protein
MDPLDQFTAGAPHHAAGTTALEFNPFDALFDDLTISFRVRHG